VGRGPKEFAAFIASENEKWSALIKRLGVRLD
jgi:tripartite-type tricarboxylate transporter receptor subunit TctC